MAHVIILDRIGQAAKEIGRSVELYHAAKERLETTEDPALETAIETLESGILEAAEDIETYNDALSMFLES